MFGITASVGIDLGTSNSLVYVKGKGIILREPSVVAINKTTGEILAIGEDAQKMIGRTPPDIETIRPLRDGVISNFDMTEAMIRHFLNKAIGKAFLFRPRVMICIPVEITEVERRTVQEVAEQAGAKKVGLIEEPIAAALGAGINISESGGSMIVDIGGGTADVAVISLGGIVQGASINVAGNTFDSDIETHIKQKHRLLIGERTAENIKMKIGAAYSGARNVTMEVRGIDLVTRMPKTMTFDTEEVVEAFGDSVRKILDCIRNVLSVTPPELSTDILSKGIVLTGGGALLYGLDKLIQNETQIPTIIAEDPLSCVAIGTGKAIEFDKNF